MIIGFSPAILMPCWAIGSDTLSPDLPSHHPTSRQPVPDAGRSPMGRARNDHATPGSLRLERPHRDVSIRTVVADQLSDVCRTSPDGAKRHVGTRHVGTV